MTKLPTGASTRTNKNAGRSAERGYVMATTALLLIPLMIFAALSVDVGSWYSEAAKIQRAADAAALAAVVHMPDVGAAQFAALEVAQANGYTHNDSDPNGVKIVVTTLGSHRIRVDITSPSPAYFGRVVTEGVDIHRYASAEYSVGVPMGSPYNSIGLGIHWDGDPDTPDGTGTPPSNAWVGQMGFCVPDDYGDIRSFAKLGSKCTGSATANPTGITAAQQSPYHDPDGYLWVVEIPEGMPSDVQVQIYDPGYCTADVRDSNNVSQRNGDRGNIHMRFTLYEADLTELDNTDNPIAAVWEPPANTGCHDIVDAPGFVIPPGEPGRWLIRSQVLPNSSSGQTYFGFSLDRTWATGGCSTVDDPLCPGVYALDQMPLRAAINEDVARFFLAEIEPVHQDKKLEVTFWDPGEGMESIQILDPTGSPVPFTWTDTKNTTTPTASLPCNQGADCLLVTNSKFNGSQVTAVIDLSLLDFSTFTNSWFSVNYGKTSSTTADWTTWGVKIVGDPIRLTE